MIEVETYNIYGVGKRTIARDVSFDKMIEIIKKLYRNEDWQPMNLDIRIERRWRNMTKEEFEEWD